MADETPEGTTQNDTEDMSSLPKDAQTIVSILRDTGVTDYEPRVVNQLLEFVYRYITDILEDAKVYSAHAGNSVVSKEDVKFAIQRKLDHSFTTPPPRDFLVDLARQKNNTPLPTLKSYTGARLPPDRYCLTSINYRLRQHSTPQKKTYWQTSGLSQGLARPINRPAINTQIPVPPKRKWQDDDDYDA